MYTRTLPLDMIRKTLYDLSVTEILSICSTDKNIQIICEDDNFWRDYILYNYKSQPWKQLAKSYGREKIITVMYQDNILNKINISPDMSLKNVLDKLNAPNHDRFTLQLIHPFNINNDYDIYYDGNKILYYLDDWINYNNNYNIGDNKIYDLLWQIKIDD